MKGQVRDRIQTFLPTTHLAAQIAPSTPPLSLSLSLSRALPLPLPDTSVSPTQAKPSRAEPSQRRRRRRKIEDERATTTPRFCHCSPPFPSLTAPAVARLLSVSFVPPLSCRTKLSECKLWFTCFQRCHSNFSAL